MILVDNQGALKLIQNLRFHKRTKHIGFKYHYIRQVYNPGLITIDYISTHEMSSDIFTKPLPSDLHWQHVKGLEMHGSALELKAYQSQYQISFICLRLGLSWEDYNGLVSR